MPHRLRFRVPESMAGERLDVACARRTTDRSRSYFTKLAASGHVLVDGRTAKPSLKVKAGMSVEIEMVPPPPLDARPEDIHVDVVFEDDQVVVVNKPAGMVVHPAAGNYEGTLVNALLYHFGGKIEAGMDPVRPGLVHRLDKDTSGLLVVAKTGRVLAFLQNELSLRRLNRQYLALVWGTMERETGTISLPVGRSERDRKKMAVNPRHGRPAVTHYEVVEHLGLADLLRLKLETGRTHQIRVHLSHFGHPVVGDATYGGRSRYAKRIAAKNRLAVAKLLGMLPRQALHAFRLEFPHPDSGQLMTFESELPDDMKQAIEYLRRNP